MNEVKIHKDVEVIHIHKVAQMQEGVSYETIRSKYDVDSKGFIPKSQLHL